MTNQPAPEFTPPPEETPAVVQFPEKDSLGRPFDGEKFLPETDSLGRWKNRRAGRKPKAGFAGAREPPPPDFSDVDAALAGDEFPEDGGAASQGSPAAVDKYTEAAAGTVCIMSTVAVLALGAHVAPKQDEISAMVKAYADCYRHYGYAPESPPWMGPAIATVAWIGPHMQDKRSQSKLQGWKLRLGAVIAKFRGRRAVNAAAAAAKAANEVEA